MIIAIEITEYLSTSMDGVDLEAEHGTEAWDDSAAGWMDTYVDVLWTELEKSFPDAEIEVLWLQGVGDVEVGVTSDAADTDEMYAEERSARHEIHLLRAACWEAIW